MRSFNFRKITEKGWIGKHTSSASHTSQPDSPESRANEQDIAINSLSTQARSEHGITTAIQEKSGIRIQPDDHPEYPHGLKLATITVAVALSVFLVALVRSPEISPAIQCLQLMRIIAN
jgi:hypothetical protein